MDIILEVANSDGEAFLVPTFECPIDPVDGKEDAIKWVEKRWRMFFEHILGSWIIDESEWPKKRTLKIFREWFDIEYKSMIWDMGNEPFVLEEWEDEDLEDGELLH